MDEHVHEWKLKAYLYIGVPVFRCAVKNCNAVLPVKEAEARLNATERLSAEDVFPEGFAIVHPNLSKLIAYADTLEEK